MLGGASSAILDGVCSICTIFLCVCFFSSSSSFFFFGGDVFVVVVVAGNMLEKQLNL